MADKSGNKVKLVVVTPYKVFFEEKVSSVTVPSLDGDYGVMAGHTPLVLALKAGICSVRIDKDYKYFTVSEGFAEIGQHLVLIVCNSAEWPEDITVKRLADTLKETKEDEARILALEDSKARKYAMKEVTQRLNRINARIDILKKYGSDVQKERLVSYDLV